MAVPRRVSSLDRTQDSAALVPRELRQAEFVRDRRRVDHDVISRSPLTSLTQITSQLLEQLARANRLNDDFLATISHELYTPLHAILGYTDLMLEGIYDPLTEKQAGALRKVKKRSRELLELITTALDASLLQQGRLPITLTEVDFLQCLEEFQHETEGWYEKPGVNVRWQIMPELPVVYTDQTKLKAVLKHLLSNAVKFTAEGRVTVSVSPRDGGVEISVADTGIGITPEVQSVMFEMFRQGDGSSTRRYRGAGLGLHMVRRMVEMLKGTLTVESKVGRGSTFRVWLGSLPHLACESHY